MIIVLKQEAKTEDVTRIEKNIEEKVFTEKPVKPVKTFSFFAY